MNAIDLLKADHEKVKAILSQLSESSSKGVWIVLIVFVPLFGLIAWALAGPKHVGRISPSQANR